MPTEALARIGRMGRIAATPPLSRYLVGHASASVGEWMKRTAVGWLLWEMTASAAWLGAFSFALLGPSFVGAIWGGALADRHDRRLLIAGAKLVSAAFVLAIIWMLLINWTDPMLMIALASAAGLAGGLAQAASKTIVSDLVPSETLPNAVALNSTVFNVATLLGPALAAALILSQGVVAALAVAALAIALHAAVVLTLPRAPTTHTARPPLHRDIAEGIAAVAGSPTLGPLMLLHAACALLVRPFLDLAPAISALVLGRGPDGVALITTGVGAGAIGGGLWLASRDGIAGLPSIVVLAALSLSAGVMAFAFVPGPWAAVALAFGIGIASILRAAGIQTLLQLASDPRLRGRVLGLYGLVLHLFGAIGALALGLVADRFGLAVALSVAGGAVLAASLILAPRLRAIPAGKPVTPNVGDPDAS